MLDGPFLGSRAVAQGLLTAAQLRGPTYTSLFRDVHVPADLAQDLALRSRGAYLLAPPHGVLVGHSAAELHGAGCSPENAPAEITAPRGELRPRRGLIVRQDVLDEDEVCTVAGCRVTTPLRTAWDLGRRLRLVEAVVAVDALARVGRFDPAALLRGRPGARGCRRLPRVVELADPRAESPMETRLRLVLVLGGLPAPELQYQVVDDRGAVLARLDLAYPDVRLAIEYDGEEHFGEERNRRDRRRDLAIADLGWDTLRFTRDDVTLTPNDTVRRVARRRTERRHLLAG
ncbi:MAG TPA: DUF559 domain-containing protein [Pseudonocardia sp.]|jgi:hypothetical protein|nr:DUF559 domain-containing protein [Pseudonocardia sp.]